MSLWTIYTYIYRKYLWGCIKKCPNRPTIHTKKGFTVISREYENGAAKHFNLMDNGGRTYRTN